VLTAGLLVALAGRVASLGAGPKELVAAAPPAHLMQLSADFLPAPPAGWQLTAFQPRQPVDAGLPPTTLESPRWTLSSGDYELQLGLAFPHAEWHDLVTCYQVQNWSVDELNLRRTGGQSSYCEVVLSRATGERGLLLYGMVDSQGRDVPASGGSLRDRLQARLRHAFGGAPLETLYEVQAWATTSGCPLDDRLRRDALAAFEQLRTSVRHALRPAEAAPAVAAEPDSVVR
jgi:hypothetical protein